MKPNTMPKGRVRRSIVKRTTTTTTIHSSVRDGVRSEICESAN